MYFLYFNLMRLPLERLYFFTLSLHRMTHKTHQIGGNEAARSQVFSLHKEAAAAAAEAVSYAYALFCRPRRN